MSQYVAPLYAKSDNKDVIRVDSITGQMPAGQLIIGSNNDGIRPALVESGTVTTMAASLVPKNGILILNNASAATAVTLPAPVSGVDDGKRLLVMSRNAQAHTLTLSLKILVAGTLRTNVIFSAASDSVELLAWGGVWHLLRSTATSVTFS